MKIFVTSKPPYKPIQQEVIILIADFMKQDNRPDIEIGHMGAGYIGSKIARTLMHLSHIETHKEIGMPIIMDTYPLKNYMQDLPNVTMFDPNPLPKADRDRIIQPVKSGQQRYSRNEPCYCGSGKKYKRCHGI